MTVATSKPKVSVYIDPDLKEDLEALAKIRKRSVSNLIEVLCQEEVDRAKKSGEIQ
jgi:predicted transcriptional regulator